MPESDTDPTAEQDVLLSVSEAAARTGLTAATLRTWHRRYGLGPSARTSGGHRRYNTADMARLRQAAHLVDSGVPPADAVAASNGESSLPQQGGRTGGGRVLPLPNGTDVQRGLARAAMSLDAREIRRTVDGLLGEHGVVRTWNEVLVPLLVAAGDRWDRTQKGVEIEHVLSGAVAAALAERADGPPIAGRPVLLACVPEEQHSLPLTALQAALTERAVPSVLLGSRVPVPALIDTVRRLRPRRLVLWAQLPGTADESILASLPDLRPAMITLLAGPGWGPPEQGRLATLDEAVAELAAVGPA